MTDIKGRAKSEVETVVVRIPRKVYVAVKKLARAEYTTPRGYIERRLSEVAMMAERRNQSRPKADDDANSGPDSAPAGYL